MLDKKEGRRAQMHQRGLGNHLIKFHWRPMFSINKIIENINKNDQICFKHTSHWGPLPKSHGTKWHMK